ncbi:MAG TPA: LON peptidase substrate-binding domain-containing protein, partial [Tenuifilaceae bacterium]|nr:LON peptidase substrate-binding domain-containing protein [Tenuifilaceae bacterium]
MSRKFNVLLKNLYQEDSMDQDQEFIPIISSEDMPDIKEGDMPTHLPILALRNAVLFPGVVTPITIGREKSTNLIKSLTGKKKILGAISQIDPNVEEPEHKDLFRVGTVAQVLKVLEMPDGTTSVILQGLSRFAVNEFTSVDPFFMANVSLLVDTMPEEDDREFKAIVSSIKDIALRIINLSPNVPPEAAFAIKNIDGTKFLVNFICSNSELPATEKQTLLEKNDFKERSIQLLQSLTREVQLLELKNDIQTKVRMDMDQQQREYYLHQQMKTIQDELGGSPIDQEIEELKKRAKDKKWSKEVAEVFDKEVGKLHRMNPMAGEYSVQLNYVQLLLDLPWNEFTTDNFDLKRAQKVLDEDHFGLEQVKERILEHLAV